MKKILSAALAAAMLLPCCGMFAVSAEEIDKGAPTAFETTPGLYAHAVLDSADADAWLAWQSTHDERFRVTDERTKYFFLPSSADAEKLDVYNAFSSAVSVNGVTIAAGDTAEVPYTAGASYTVNANGTNYTLRCMKSTAEAAIYINNSDADGNGTELMAYLNQSKSLSAKATGAIVDADGSIDNTAVKKIKGRGNTTWDKPKKAYNITYDKKVSIAGMAKNKKYSILANYQDDSLSRNRFLYDLSDAVGVPYASDSRYVDFYANGYYWGSYQMTEKVESGSLVPEVDEEGYLDENGNVKEDFAFIAEVDASAGADDYYVRLDNGINITIKAPEIDYGMPGYDEVKAYVKEKFTEFQDVVSRPSGKVETVADIDSVTKLYLINELGKNWDSGVSSTFFTYRPDENGEYRFYGSPVWDYDNSLGNAVGVSSDLRAIGVNDYTSYTGWWCQYKSSNSTGGGKYSNNIVNNLAKNKAVLARAAEIWFEEFMPAIRHFEGSFNNPVVNPELYTSENYYSLVSGTAAMNYTSGWLLNTGSWIADHSSLYKAHYDLYTGEYTVDKTATRYSSDFKGMFDFTADWMTSRAAWLSNEMQSSYGKSIILGDINRENGSDVVDATAVQRYSAVMESFTSLEYELGDVDGDGVISVSDATLIQMYAAGLISKYPADKSTSEPDNPQPTTAPVTQPVTSGDNTVSFINTLDWDGDIYCYYWGGADTIEWNGVPMQLSGSENGHDLYTYTVPEDITNVIFNNGSVQTDNIDYTPGATYYAIDSLTPKGRYEWGVK